MSEGAWWLVGALLFASIAVLIVNWLNETPPNPTKRRSEMLETLNKINPPENDPLPPAKGSVIVRRDSDDDA